MFCGKPSTRLGPFSRVWNTSLCSGHKKQPKQRRYWNSWDSCDPVRFIINYSFFGLFNTKTIHNVFRSRKLYAGNQKKVRTVFCLYCGFNNWPLNQYFGCLLLKNGNYIFSLSGFSTFYFFFSSFLVIEIIVHVQYWLKRIFCVLVVCDCFQIFSLNEKENKRYCNELMTLFFYQCSVSSHVTHVVVRICHIVFNVGR